MPQTLHEVDPDAGAILNVVGVHPMRERPALALLAMEAIASWSSVESFMLDVYLHFAGGNRSVGADIFLALNGLAAKKKVLKRITSALGDNEKLLFRAISRLVDDRAESRNYLAHGVWGLSPNLPDALLIADMRDLAQIDYAAGDLRQFLARNMYVYRAQDFEEITRNNEELASFGLKFRFILEGHPANTGNRLYDELCNAPSIAGLLNQ